jgi:hypothetical protein
MGILKAKSDGVQSADDSAAGLSEAVGLVQRQCGEILDQIKTINDRLSQLSARESELRSVLKREATLEPHMDTMLKIVSKRDTTGTVTAAIERAPLKLEPFPYAIVDDLLPVSLYRCLLRGIPPRDLFTSKAPDKEHVNVPFTLAPAYCRRVWRFMGDVVVPQIITPRILEKFRAPIDEWIAGNWPGLAPDSVPLHGSGGRIMLRRPGYRIMPHRDPKWGFITCILYLARPQESDGWGTQLYAVDGDQEAKNAAPYWIDPQQCRLVEDVAFRPNRLLVFLNSTGAHGAHIPEDAQPPTLERCIYQFRVGPPTETITMLKSSLPEEHQKRWAGKALVDEY